MSKDNYVIIRIDSKTKTRFSRKLQGRKASKVIRNFINQYIGEETQESANTETAIAKK